MTQKLGLQKIKEINNNQNQNNLMLKYGSKMQDKNIKSTIMNEKIAEME